MAGFCHFWRLSPREYYDLDADEIAAMNRHMERVAEAHNRKG